MTAIATKIPTLRFLEFEGEWEEKKLGEDINLISGQHLSPGEYNNDEDGVPYFTGPSDFTNDANCLTKWTRKSTKTAIINDVLLTVKGSGVGSIMFLKLPEVAMGRQLMAVRAKGAIAPFLYQILSMKAQLFEKLAAGNMIPGITREDILQTKVHLPTLPEQQKIATFLSTIDTRIQQLSRKKALLEQYKKGVMQQIFSQEIRFKDEDGKEFPAWEEKVFNKFLLESRLGGNYSNSEEKTNYPLIKMGNLDRGNIVLGKLEYISEGEKIDFRDKINYGDLFFNTRNTLDLVGKVAIWKNELPLAYYNSNLMFIRFENNFFMNYRLNSFDGLKKLRRIATGTTSVAAIYSKDLFKIKLSLPTLPEQQKIAAFLSTLDRQINLVSQQLERMQTFKKGLLQQMFV